MKQCVSCKKSIPDPAQACVYCGAKQGGQAKESTPAAGAEKKTMLGYAAVNEEMLKELGVDPEKARAVTGGAPAPRPAGAPSPAPKPGPAPEKTSSVAPAKPAPAPAPRPAPLAPAPAPRPAPVKPASAPGAASLAAAPTRGGTPAGPTPAPGLAPAQAVTPSSAAPPAPASSPAPVPAAAPVNRASAQAATMFADGPSAPVLEPAAATAAPAPAAAPAAPSQAATVFMDGGSSAAPLRPPSQPVVPLAAPPAAAPGAPAQVATLYMEGGSSSAQAAMSGPQPPLSAPPYGVSAGGAPTAGAATTGAPASAATAYFDPTGGAPPPGFAPAPAPPSGPLITAQPSAPLSGATAFMDPSAPEAAFAGGGFPGAAPAPIAQAGAQGAWPSPTPSAQQAAAQPLTPGTLGTRVAYVLFGAALLASFFVPFGGGSLLATLKALSGLDLVAGAWVAAAGALLLIFGLTPVAPKIRGVVGTVAGLGGVVLLALAAGAFDWKGLVTDLGYVLLAAGALLTLRAPMSGVGRYLATVGFLAVVVPLVVPSGGTVPIAGIFQTFGSAPKQAIGALLPLVVGLLAVIGPIASASLGEVMGWTVVVTVALQGLLAAPAFAAALLPALLVPMGYVGGAGFGLARVLAVAPT